jgi:REP element-mobilizing transposase RayT
MKPKQLSFLPRQEREFDPTERKGRRKTARPFHPKLALHITMRSNRARGAWSMLKTGRRLMVQDLAHRTARKHRIELYRFANVGNHLHLLVKAKDRAGLRGFLREFAGVLAARITGAIKGRPQKFWDAPAWSKIVEWGRQFENTARYILLNLMETSGLRDPALLARLERDGVLWVGRRERDHEPRRT